MSVVTQILSACRPIVGFTALIFGVLAAAKGLTELVPVLGQVLPVRGDAQRMAILAAALALVSGRT
jgi:hypothetical protein